MRSSQLNNVAKVACGLFLLFGGKALAQVEQPEVVRDTIMVFEDRIVLNEPEIKTPKFKIGGVFQARFLNNFKSGVDVNGLQHSDGTGVDNTFEIRRMRVSLAAKISNNLEVNALVNFADFKNTNVSTKVLENAYAKYTFNRYLQVTIGQFRPLFGMEETYPVDIVKSIDYSNSYYLFGANGWMSFQIGAALTGSVDLGKVPMSYGVSVTNGNGKNTIANDNGKHYSSRFLFNIDKKHNFNVGMSGGIGEYKDREVYAVGVEATAKFDLADRWSIDFQTEAKQGTNYSTFFKQQEGFYIGELSNYLMKSFYILPNIRYEVGMKRLQAIEFACRYEYLDAASGLNNAQSDAIKTSARQTFTPMLSLEFMKDYGARLQIGMQIDNFKKNYVNTANYNSNLAFVQLQCRIR